MAVATCCRKFPFSISDRLCSSISTSPTRRRIRQATRVFYQQTFWEVQKSHLTEAQFPDLVYFTWTYLFRLTIIIIMFCFLGLFVALTDTASELLCWNCATMLHQYKQWVDAVTWNPVSSLLSGTLQHGTASWPVKVPAARPRSETLGWLETFTGTVQHRSLNDIGQQDRAPPVRPQVFIHPVCPGEILGVQPQDVTNENPRAEPNSTTILELFYYLVEGRLPIKK